MDPRNLSIGDFVRRQAKLHGNRRLATFEDGSTLTYGEADALSETFGAGLLAAGIPAGGRVGTMLDSCREHLVASFGCAKAGLEEVPLHSALKGAGLTHILRTANIRLVIVDPQFVDCLREVEGQLEQMPVLVRLGSDFDKLLRAPATALPQVSPFQVSSILFTSGTTGLPKGVVRSHRADLLSGWRAREAMDYRPDDVLFNVFPLAHINAKCNTLFGAMLVGASVVLYGRFSASRFWETTRRHGITSASFQGAMLEILWKTRSEADRDNPVCTGRAAPVPAHLHKDFEAFFGIRLHETYGATETGVLTVNRDRRPGSIGECITDHFELAVLDENDDPVPDGQPGLLSVRPRLASVMFGGYLGMPEYTLGVSRNLWHHMGDVVVRDASGYFGFVRRNSSTIRRRGENITPWEVERAIGEVPGVLECAAYGVPSELGEEEVMVAVAAQADAVLDPAAIVRHCEAVLPRFAVPRYLRFVPAIPKNDSQKPVVTGLKAEAVTADTWERPA